MTDSDPLAWMTTPDGRASVRVLRLAAGADAPQDRLPQRRRLERQFRDEISRGGWRARTAQICLDALLRNVPAVAAKTTEHNPLVTSNARALTAHLTAALWARPMNSETRPPRTLAPPLSDPPEMLTRAPRAPGVAVQRTA